MTLQSLLRAACVLVLFASTACGGDVDDPGSDAAPQPEDTGTADVAPDAAPDAEADTTPDAEADTTPDAAPDAEADTAPDAEADTTPDAAADTAPDAELDTTPDAAADTTPDAEADTTPDAAVDTTPDAEPDTTPDAAVDTTPDAEADTTPVDLPTIPNGDFADGATDWTLGDGASVDATAGPDGSAALVLASNDDCTSARASTPLDLSSVREPKGLAVAFTYRLDSPFDATVRLGDNALGSIPPVSAFTPAVACIGGWQGGAIADLAFEWRGPYAECDALSTRLVVDDITVVEDARCLAPVEGTFEPSPGPPALLSPFELITDHPTASVTIVQDASEAHTGEHAVRIDLTGHCGIASVQVFELLAPDVLTGPRPGVRFWARGAFDATSASAIGIASDGGFGITSIGTSAAWRSYDICLTGTSAGATVDVGISLFGTDVCSDAEFPAETLWIDDVTFVDDATCP